MPAIQKVAVVGPTGNLGPSIIKALLASGFDVTAITRQSSTSTFAPEISVRRVDFASHTSLVNALRGHDAVVSTLALEATGGQKPLIDAAIDAKVSRFVPSEYGVDLNDARQVKMGRVVRDKVETQDYLKELARRYEWFSWTGVATNWFFDWALNAGLLGFDLKNHKATIVDSGDEVFSATNIDACGRAVAAILRHPEQTANQYIRVASILSTQNNLLQILEEEMGSKFDVQHVSSMELEKSADEKFAAGDAGFFVDYSFHFIFADDAGHAIRPEDGHNGMLGLEMDDVRETVRRVTSSLHV